tara:strand:+ start:144 stop:566 length:423 start_codon:yes stop_codon:yes gene_type:complete
MVLTEEQKKINRSISKKKWDSNNKEKIKQYSKDNKEIIAEQQKEYYLDNIDKIKERQKQYRINNYKQFTISQWKHQGIIDGDFNRLYDYFITQTNCWICNKNYNKDIVIDRRCIDHDNTIDDEPNVRYICCVYCNLHIIK